MGLDILDICFRLERRFGIKIDRQEFFNKSNRNGEPPDYSVGDLFEYVRERAVRDEVFDADLDADAQWPVFQEILSDALGVEPGQVTKESWLIRDLGAG